MIASPSPGTHVILSGILADDIEELALPCVIVTTNYSHGTHVARKVRQRRIAVVEVNIVLFGLNKKNNNKRTRMRNEIVPIHFG